MRIPKRRLPQVFLCPRCGKEAVRVEFVKEDEKATVHCGGCSLTNQLSFKQTDKEIDVYCKFTDRYYSELRTAKSSEAAAAS
ncbi:MAG: hypothetical protein JSV64_03240 [Candidatus Bathyarchaeota archaeon]|nr:MAG: hypothetical protein JSV64_03240 [Candidatus Bathyarchaeota archaeon]